MTTEQRAERAERTGFRLPWSSDRRTASPEGSEEPAAPAEKPAAQAEEPGTGWVLAGAAGATTAEPTASAELADPSADEPAAGADEESVPLPGDWARSEGEEGSGGWVLAGAVTAATEPESGEAVNGEAEADERASLTWPAEDAPRAKAPVPAAEAEPTTSTSGEDAIGAPGSPAAAGTEDTDMTIATATPGPAKAAAPAHAPSAASAAARPSKFMADLSRAMQVAAQAARDESLAKVAAEAKQRIEEIQQQGSSGTTELRRRADDDVAATREWSKAEIARIREETDRRISERKARLEADVEQHAVQIRGRADLVRGAVTEHETALAAFIERLMVEEDPARIATLAQSMPEAPVLDEVDAAGTEWTARDDGESANGEGANGMAGDVDSGDVDSGEGTAGAAAKADADAAAEVDAEATAQAEVETMPGLSDEGAAAAEAEALGGLEGGLAATYWLDRQRADEQDEEAANEAVARTSLLVTGLSTVAGIAGFKRELSRVEGVRSVGVSAGESGQFVFAVSHMPDVDLAAAIPTIATFQASITGESPDGVVVTAVEPATDD